MSNVDPFPDVSQWNRYPEYDTEFDQSRLEWRNHRRGETLRLRVVRGPFNESRYVIERLLSGGRSPDWQHLATESCKSKAIAAAREYAEAHNTTADDTPNDG